MQGTCSRRAFLAGAFAATAACTSTHAGRRGPVVVPLVYDETGTLLVAARVAGRTERHFVLDTGASRSLLATQYATELGLSLRDGGPVEGSAGIVASRSALADVEVPGIEPFAVDFTVYDFASHDLRCVGILGAELLGRAPFRLRYRAGELVWNVQLPASVIPLQLDNRIPRITVAVGEVDLPLRLDTGAALAPGDEAYISVTETQAALLGLTGKPVAVWSATGTGGATLALPVHRLSALRIGDRSLERAFAIVQPRVGYFARDDAVGFLGNAVLDKLDPFLDYERGAFAVAT